MVGNDKFVRSLQLEKIVEQELSSRSKEENEMLEAYADGVNSFMDSTYFLPFEFYFTRTNFARWTPKDSLMIFKLFSFDTMSTGWQQILLRAAIESKLLHSWTELLVPHNETNLYGKQEVIVGQTDSAKEIPVKNILLPQDVIQTEAMNKEDMTKNEQSSIQKGSNSWVISGNFTESHSPILSCDLQLSQHLPGKFYFASLNFSNGDLVTGATIPGVPLIIIGRNQELSWGVGVSNIESIAIFSLTLNEDKTQYYYCKGWKNLTVTEESIPLGNGNSISYKTYRTHYGPVVDLSQETAYPFE